MLFPFVFLLLNRIFAAQEKEYNYDEKTATDGSRSHGNPMQGTGHT